MRYSTTRQSWTVSCLSYNTKCIFFSVGSHGQWLFVYNTQWFFSVVWSHKHLFSQIDALYHPHPLRMLAVTITISGSNDYQHACVYKKKAYQKWTLFFKPLYYIKYNMYQPHLQSKSRFYHRCNIGRHHIWREGFTATKLDSSTSNNGFE